MESRQALRRYMRKRRNNLSDKQQTQAASDLLDLFEQHALLSTCEHIALYLANDGEISPHRVVQRAWEMGKHCYLPVISNSPERGMVFAHYDSQTKLKENRFGIPEPAVEADNIIAADALDLVLLPLVAFDHMGGRLGMGGGYYDRAFSFKAGYADQKPVLLGLAHHCQEKDALELASWDIPLTAVATDQRLVAHQIGAI